MRIIGIIILVMLLGKANASEQLRIEFNKTSHYFGTFSKSRGKVSYRFEFVNKGDKASNIRFVKATCGCTATDYSRETLMPGEKGYVNVTFDPARFSGYFSKKVNVYFEGTKTPVELSVTGRIRVNHKVTDEFTKRIGDLQSDKRNVAFGEVAKQDKHMTQAIRLINIMRDSIYASIVDSPEWLACTLNTSGFAQGSNGLLRIMINPSQIDDWGSLEDTIKVKIKRGAKSEVVAIKVSIDLIDTFEESQQNPSLSLVDGNTIQISKKKSTKKFTTRIKIKNTGTSDLIIRNVQSNSSSLVVKEFDTTIAPGKKGKISITHFPSEEEGEKGIVVWSNSPGQYKTEIHIIKI